MRHRAIRRAAALATLLLAAPLFAQYREYYVRGRVVDPQKKPIPGVEIEVRDVETSRTYHMATDKDGVFKLAGLPHGKYAVSFSREGYVAAQDEWKFEAKQERMQKVDVPDVVLVSQSQVQKALSLKEADSAVKEAGERLRTRDFDGSIALLQAALGKNPKDANALFFLGLSYAGKKMYREATDALTQVTELTPDFPGAYFELGVCLRQLGDVEGALASYEKNLELDPANANSAYNAGLILFETNRIEEALALLREGPSLEAGRPGAPGDDGKVLHPPGEVRNRGGAAREGSRGHGRPRQARLPRPADLQDQGSGPLTSVPGSAATRSGPVQPVQRLVGDRGRARQLGVLPRQLRLPEARVDGGEQVVHLEIEDGAAGVRESEGALGILAGGRYRSERQVQLASLVADPTAARGRRTTARSRCDRLSSRRPCLRRKRP